MDLSKLQDTDLFGRFYLKVQGSRQFDTYFQTICALRPLLSSKEWDDAVTGYYINVADNMDTARLSYFTATSDDVISCVGSFCQQNNIIESQRRELPHLTRIVEGYGNEELRFRRYLYIYNLIGLDIMRANLLNARCLMATFRFHVLISGEAWRPHFEKTFEIQSPSYNSLSPEQKEQFWRDFSNSYSWAHMMVNMVLPGDLNEKAHLDLVRNRPVTINEMNNYAGLFGFQIPGNWHPNVKP